MPIWDFECVNGHRVERLVKIEDRDRPRLCSTCREPLARKISPTHVAPDGVYSYAPNVGDPERFERQRQAMKDGVKVIPRSLTPLQEERRQEENWRASRRSPA
jgi:putative FmdB family regulatory protein